MSTDIIRELNLKERQIRSTVRNNVKLKLHLDSLNAKHQERLELYQQQKLQVLSQRHESSLLQTQIRLKNQELEAKRADSLLRLAQKQKEYDMALLNRIRDS
ncbi:hypothetical protein RCL1_001965 [Eukaryota sp. TZLM3-RCL]